MIHSLWLNVPQQKAIGVIHKKEKRQMWKKILAVTASLLLSVHAMSSTADARTKVNIGVWSTTPYTGDIPLQVALEMGFFAKNDLDVEIVHFNKSGHMAVALVSGDVDLVVNSAALGYMKDLDENDPKPVILGVASRTAPFGYGVASFEAPTIADLLGKELILRRCRPYDGDANFVAGEKYPAASFVEHQPRAAITAAVAAGKLPADTQMLCLEDDQAVNDHTIVFRGVGKGSTTRLKQLCAEPKKFATAYPLELDGWPCDDGRTVQTVVDHTTISPVSDSAMVTIDGRLTREVEAAIEKSVAQGAAWLLADRDRAVDFATRLAKEKPESRLARSLKLGGLVKAIDFGLQVAWSAECMPIEGYQKLFETFGKHKVRTSCTGN